MYSNSPELPQRITDEIKYCWYHQHYQRFIREMFIEYQVNGNGTI